MANVCEELTPLKSYLCLTPRLNNIGKLTQLLEAFVTENEDCFCFCDRVCSISSKEKFVNAILSFLKNIDMVKYSDYLKASLCTLRILSREKIGLGYLCHDEGIELLLLCAGVIRSETYLQLSDSFTKPAKFSDTTLEPKQLSCNFDIFVKAEAIKCLHNLIFGVKEVTEFNLFY
jgi:hypothetical protein